MPSVHVIPTRGSASRHCGMIAGSRSLPRGDFHYGAGCCVPIAGAILMTCHVKSHASSITYLLRVGYGVFLDDLSTRGGMGGRPGNFRCPNGLASASSWTMPSVPVIPRRRAASRQNGTIAGSRSLPKDNFASRGSAGYIHTQQIQAK
jgi:hypothetical protein